MAPEVIRGNYSEQCDVWSLGVILYIMLSGWPPFNGRCKEEIYQAIKRGTYSLDRSPWDAVSPEAKDIVRQMLTADPALRPSAQELYTHPWLTTTPTGELSKTLRTLAEFQGAQKIRQAALNYIACKMLSVQEIERVRRQFYELDVDGDGKISLEELELGFERVQLRGAFDVYWILINCDADRNDVIDYTEFLAAALDWKLSLSQERLIKAFQAYDTDGNGKISLGEVKAFLGDQQVDDEVWEQLFADADLNKDGYIDIDEFRILMNKVIN